MKRRLADKILLMLLCSALLLGCVGLTFFPAARYSERENRMLASLPSLTRESLTSGELGRALDTYATERAPFRGICRSLWSTATLALGQAESHGVILCRDGSLSRRIVTDPVVLEKNLAVLSRISAALGDTPLVVAIAPRRIDARKAVLPRLYDTSEELAVYDALPDTALTFPDCTDDADWFRTDHHWTATGAYHAYVALAPVLGYTPHERTAFTPVTVSTTFRGTSCAAAGIPFVRPDEIVLWRYADDEAYRVVRDGMAAQFCGLYDLSRLSCGDQYSVFLGGNCGILEIDRGDEDTRPVLLMVKDSFANALIPFLAQHFRIAAIDPRYRAASLSVLAERADAALVLCGLQTIGCEPFLTPLLRR